MPNIRTSPSAPSSRYEQDGLTLPRAVVVLRGEATLDVGALQAFVKTQLSPHKYPREVVAVDTLPKTRAGSSTASVCPPRKPASAEH